MLTVDNQIDPNTGTLKLKAVFDNEENTLFPNQFVNARLLLETRKNQVISPSVAIQRGSQGTFVYVVNRPAERCATGGFFASHQRWDLIEGNDASQFDQSGVQAGDSVVIDGADKLQPGSLVAPTAPTVQKFVIHRSSATEMTKSPKRHA